MSKVDELKNKFPMFNITLLDLFKRLDKTKTKKYVHAYCVIIEDKLQQRLMNNDNVDEIKRYFDKIGFDYDGLDNSTSLMFNHLFNLFNTNDYEIVSDFIEFMERGLIPNKDILTYKTSDSIIGAITMASIKSVEKELESKIIKEYEDDRWLIVRPLSFDASSKYGAGTRWCTTYKSEKEYFARYFTNGALVYFINKITGYKFAFYKDMRQKEDISFWNAEDTRIDFLSLEIDDYLFSIMKAFAKTEKRNIDFCTKEEINQLYLECKYVDSRDEVAVLAVPQPVVELTIPVNENVISTTIPQDGGLSINYHTTITTNDNITLTN